MMNCLLRLTSVASFLLLIRVLCVLRALATGPAPACSDTAISKPLLSRDCSATFPALRTRHRRRPAFAQSARGRSRHLRIETAVDAPLIGDFGDVRPEPDAESGKVRGAERGRLRDGRPDNRHAE